MKSSLSVPLGTPWCQGRPALWFVGHQSDNERPNCLETSNNGISWTKSTTTVLDRNDTLNPTELRESVIDRHGCAILDIDLDGINDVVCTVGANKGKGTGHNEVYLTNPSNGSLIKVMDATLGLSKYPTMRPRIATALQGPDNKTLVFIGVLGKDPREDGQYNQHTMFRNDYNILNPDQRPWFREVQETNGPWKKVQSEVICAVAADITGNGVDDLILCQEPGLPMILLQGIHGAWRKLPFSVTWATSQWRNVKLADVTGDGRLDLMAVDKGSDGSRLWIFRGIAKSPYFDFDNPWYKTELPFAAPDVDLLDVNGDGLMDVYVVQTNEANGYCRDGRPNHYWGNTVQPDPSWIPPLDIGRDVLFLQKARPKQTAANRFWPLKMKFQKRGCGNLAIQFGSRRRLILGNGNLAHPGHHMFLHWGK